MSERLQTLAENNKFVCLKKEVNDIINELLEESGTDIRKVNHSIYAAATVITETVTQPSKSMKNRRLKDFWKIRIQKQMNRWRKTCPFSLNQALTLITLS
jgi:hypothetical protein